MDKGRKLLVSLAQTPNWSAKALGIVVKQMIVRYQQTDECIAPFLKVSYHGNGFLGSSKMLSCDARGSQTMTRADTSLLSDDHVCPSSLASDSLHGQTNPIPLFS